MLEEEVWVDPAGIVDRVNSGNTANTTTPGATQTRKRLQRRSACHRPVQHDIQQQWQLLYRKLEDAHARRSALEQRRDAGHAHDMHAKDVRQACQRTACVHSHTQPEAVTVQARTWTRTAI
jgi:hypothetical protein